MKVGRYEFNIPEKSGATDPVANVGNVGNIENTSAEPGEENSKVTFEDALKKASAVTDKGMSGSINVTGINAGDSGSMGKITDAINQKNEIENLTKSLDSGIASGDREKLKKVSEEFEEIYINIMLKQMRSTIGDGGGFIEKSFARSMYEDMYFDNVSKEISKGQGLGIGKMMYEQMLRTYTKNEEDYYEYERNNGVDTP